MAAKKEKPSFKDQFAALRNLPGFFRMIWETHSGYTLTTIFLRLVKAGIPLAMLYVGKEIIDEILHLIELGDGPGTWIWWLVGIELALALASELLNRATILTDSLLGDLFSNRISERLIRHAAKLDLAHFENPEFYDKLERARRQTTGRTVLMSQVLTQMEDIITVIFLGAGLVIFNPWLLLLLVVAAIPLFLGESHFNQKSYSLTRGWTPERRELDYLRYIGASDDTAKEVRMFNLAGFLADRFRKVADKYYDANRGLASRRAFWGMLLSWIGTFSYYGAYVFIIFQAVYVVITIGTLTFLAGSFNKMRSSIQGIMRRFSQITDAALYLQDLFDFFALEPEISQSGKRLMPGQLQHGFTFENVSFRYPNTEKWVLRNVSFTLKAGEKLALVGENGAGKTTLVKLLARLYVPTEGRILLDGVDLSDYDSADLNRNIGVIFQDYYRYQMQVSENIAVGKIEQVEELTSIQSAARKSLADPMIQDLPDGYHQILGRRFAQGVDLSGGQWQKIALARAYMRDAQLLILDEPTSALDARAEHEVFQRFSELIKDRSAVLISHRFSTVRMADRILVLNQGEVLELGSHQELLDQNGKYAELFRLQAKGYL